MMPRAHLILHILPLTWPDKLDMETQDALLNPAPQDQALNSLDLRDQDLTNLAHNNPDRALNSLDLRDQDLTNLDLSNPDRALNNLDLNNQDRAPNSLAPNNLDDLELVAALRLMIQSLVVPSVT